MSFFTFPGPESEKFFMMLANSQGRRLDDQRVSLASLPGVQNESTASAPNAADIDASYLYDMVSKVQVGLIRLCSFYRLIPQNLTLFADEGCFNNAAYLETAVQQRMNSESVLFSSHRDQEWMNRDVLHPKSPLVPHLPGTKITEAQTHLKNLPRALPP